MRIESIDGLLIANEVARTSYLVRITTDSGLIGIGQSGSWGFPDAVAKVVDQYRPTLIGEDPFRIEYIQQALYRSRPFRGNIIWGALSAIDIALWDIKAQHFSVPVWELLGGRLRDRVRLHALIFAADPDDLRRQALEMAEAGFTAIKFDPFQAGYQDHTMPRIIAGAREMAAAAREAVGLDVDIIFELHRKMTPMRSVAVANALAEFQPLFVEDPIQIDSIDLQGDLVGRFEYPLANGERLDTIWEFRDLLARGAQYLRPDLGQAGGLTGCKKIAALGEAHHAAFVSHNYLSPLLTAAAVHLAVSIPNFLTQEYHLLDESQHPGTVLFRTSIRREGGYIATPEAPGLGVELDEALVAQAPPAEHSLDIGLYRDDGSPAYAG